EGHHLVGINVHQRLLAEELFDVGPDGWHPGRAAYQDHAIEVGGLDAGVLQGPATCRTGALDERLDEPLEVGSLDGPPKLGTLAGAEDDLGGIGLRQVL